MCCNLDKRSIAFPFSVMAGLVPAIHADQPKLNWKQWVRPFRVDTRDKRGHDGIVGEPRIL